MPPVRGRDGLDDRQTQANAVGTAHEALARPRDDIHRETGTVVGHLDDSLAVGVTDGHRDMATRVAHRVLYEVAERAFECFRVTDRARVTDDVDRDGRRRA